MRDCDVIIILSCLCSHQAWRERFDLFKKDVS